MPKKISLNELRPILDAVEKYPAGAKLEEILSCLSEPMERRALQRRLAILVAEGLLIVEGRSRARRYKLSSQATSQPSTSDVLPLSREAKEVQSLVTAPIQKRLYTGYHREFLDGYTPNSTYYLDETTRNALREMGKSPDGRYPAGTYARQIFHRLLIDLSWNSSRLEGNTYSLLETDRLLHFNQIVENKDRKDAQMILNHKEAIEFLVNLEAKLEVSRYTILNLHALLSHNLLGDPQACGRIRSIPVGIGKTVYMPLEIPQLLEECFEQVIQTANAIKDPFEQAFFLMVHIPYLQPFEDVNKRVSRLAANIPFIRENLSPLSFVDVPKEIYISGLLGIYEFNRIELLRDVFVWAYKRSSSLYAATRKVLGEPDPFRLQYRLLIRKAIEEIIDKKLDKKSAHAWIEKKKSAIAMEDQEKFVEIVETELMSLHEGNIARYHITPKAYEAWLKFWK